MAGWKTTAIFNGKIMLVLISRYCVFAGKCTTKADF